MSRINVLAEAVKGLKANIYAVDNLSPVSRIAVSVKAGSRYEPDDVPGISHYVSRADRLTNGTVSSLAITRYLERNGASMSVVNDRELITYRITCLRNKLNNVLHFIDDAIHKPEFRTWELYDHMRPRLAEDIKHLKKNQEFVSNEALHKAAYRGGLAHSTIIPEHQISKITQRNLLDYVENNYVLSNLSIVGLGVDENDLRSNIESNFSFRNTDPQGVSGASVYLGGEARIQAGFPNTLVKFVFEGCSSKDIKGQAALEVLGSILGDQKQIYVKYGSGPSKSLANVVNTSGTGIKTSIVNINHSDTGLFGISLLGSPEHMRGATSAAVRHLRHVLSNISEAELKTAKKIVRGRSLVSSENGDFVFNSLIQRHFNNVVQQSPIDHLDKLSLKDVQEVANKILKRKATIVSIGNPRFIPYLHELES